MKHFLFLLLSLLPLALGAAEPVPAKPESFHLFILAGQSNMAGRGPMDDEARSEPQRILKWTADGHWAPATEPLHWDKTGAAVGPGRAFAQVLVEKDPALVVGLIPTACGGSPIRTWKPGGYHGQTSSHPYDDALQRARAAMASGTLKAILWHQGESDIRPGAGAAYEKALRELIARFRSDLAMPELPFLIGQLGRFPGKEWGEEQKEIDAAQRRVADSVPNVCFVTSQGLASRGDNFHFSAEAARELGRRYAEAYQERFGKSRGKP